MKTTILLLCLSLGAISASADGQSAPIPGLPPEASARSIPAPQRGKAGGKVTACQLQMRRGSTGAFGTVGMFTGRVYLDHTPLAVPGVPEVREYQLLAMQNDVVIGQPSPIHTVTVS